MKKLLTLLLLLCCGILSAQCPDFTNLAGSGVTCQYGSFNDPFQYTGVASGRHTIITQQGADPYTGYQLPMLPPGESAVVKLGNELVGAEAEAITYTCTVNPDFTILLLKFAVVFEDPGHPDPEQPRFVVRVLNSAGQLVDDCAEYDVTAGNVPGFLTYTSAGHNVRYRPWTNVGIDLSNYAGQEVQVQFITYDCSCYGHFSYAYFTATNISNKLSYGGCTGEQITIYPPADFESYQWDNGSTGQTATYTVTDGATPISCLITSATGCQFTLSGTLFSQLDMPTQSAIYFDTICEGDGYHDHYFDLSPLYKPGDYMVRNTYYSTSNCSGGNVTTTLFLTILPKYHHVYDAVCQGDNYDAHGFHYTNLQPGEYTDTLVTVSATECDWVTVLHLTVNPTFQLPNTISGPTTVCQNEVVQYVLQQSEGLNTLNWVVPDGVIMVRGQGTDTVNLYFSNMAPNPASILLVGANGCGSGSVPIVVSQNPTYHIFYQDTLCTGHDYHRYGFNLARQDSTGWYTFTNRYTTAQGCDSVRILQLLVTGTPTLTTLAQPAEICTGQGSTIHAMGANAGFTQGGTPPTVAIGDILCTDNSIVKPSAWPVAGKTAKGIVFYVDNTGSHGWAVHLQEDFGPGGHGVSWSHDIHTDILTLINYTSARDAIMDLDGYSNTQMIRNAGDANIYPAAYAVDFANGWYLPAAGQLRLLVGEFVTLNASLQVVGGTQFPTDSGRWYLSSTKYAQSLILPWVVGLNGIVYVDLVSGDNFTLRSVRSF
jgi:hypothetical protein